MLDLRPILFVLGLLISTIGVSMLLPTMIGFIDGRDGLVYLGSSGFLLFIGILMVLSARGTIESMGQRETFFVTVLAWSLIPLLVALPFYFTASVESYSDAYFEAMSGLTTTGSTVISHLSAQSHATLFWRSFLQWLGGIGIVVMALSVFPFLKVGGMQLFKIEFTGKGDKATPRAIQLMALIMLVYGLITVSCFLLYWICGMSPFNALNHAMTTVATGGFSTHDQSIGYYDDALIELVAVFFMILGSVPFLLYVQALKGTGANFFKDTQVLGLIFLIFFSCIVMTFYLGIFHYDHWLVSLRYAVFNVTSIMTGTGYATAPYDMWGVFAIVMFLFVMFIGGCAGSTTCGIKIFRIQVLLAIARTQIHHLLRPNAVLVTHYAGRPLPAGVGESVMGFFFLFIVSFAISACMLGLTGLDFITSVSGAATAIANVGPGLGSVIGPNGNFSTLPESAKWILALTMMIGRLEILTVLVIFSRKFWLT
ncbi:MAG: TrkH family potassium uptake protein [Pseudomonadota bacterium]